MSLQDVRDQAEVIFGSFEDAAEFVTAWLDAYADHLEDTEPYATKAINGLRNAAHQADELIAVLEELD